MRETGFCLLACLILTGLRASLYAQSTVPVSAAASSLSSPADARSAKLEQRIETISSSLDEAHQQLEQSRKQILQLQRELLLIKEQLAATQPVHSEQSSADNSNVDVAKTTASAIEDLQERQQTLEEQVKLHEQTKIESDSKYPVRITGLILFNSFINKGIVDNIDLPEVALSASNDSGDGSGGAGFRQTILGLQGFGPRIAGAKTSADVNLDFFGGLAYGSSATSAGIVRMRTASINLDWEHDSIQAGMVGPLISPLSPTSYATVAEPSLSGAGNLWTWSPQLRYAHQTPLQSGRQLQFEFGLWDPQTAGYSTNLLFRSPSPGEYSKQPAYESRISYGTAKDFYGNSASEHPLQIGLGGYYSRQSYPYGESLDTWAVTADWRVPFNNHFEVSGEGYRGRGLGGLGGGVYKDILVGINPVTGQDSYRGLNAIGGWAQFKTRYNRSIEANASLGLDDGFAGDFHALQFPAAATAVQLRARNQMFVANLIYRPKTYIILSPEYRRIWTWPIYGSGSTADIFTLSAGYQF
ncbi:hypothetical protein [Tunturiibacter gelidoferens]|uniref:Coiled-coil protein SlyX n=1 Tax=Tunturiibacter gelidiferens TaxID=3069689 RepID=A0ACC5NVS2_9BACT|nr:hypothetical protein [Edaphobacter lichenicola]MBB5338654.1 putative coiled-coil protein SlyX [Edaphobacter lichenicola]